MCSSSWPLLVDLTRDESKRILRTFELEAYAAIVSAFRGQGNLNKDKRKVLQELQQLLSVSPERHRAEIRRAVNNEQLTTVATNLGGPDVSSEWHVEGRRLVPIMPRLVPQTAFSVTADHVANQQARHNHGLLQPADTGNKDLAGASAPPNSIHGVTSAVGSRAARASSPTPTSNMLVLPSGMAIQIKDEEPVIVEEEKKVPSRRRHSHTEISSSCASYHRHPPHPSSIHHPTPPRPVSIPATPATNPSVHMKVVRSPGASKAVTTPSGQKVIIVSNAHSSTTSSSVVGSHSTSSSLLHRAVSAFPMVKSSSAVTTTVSTVMYPRSSVMPSVSVGAESAGKTNVITIAATGSTASSTTSLSTSGISHQPHIPNVGPRHRIRTISARPRTPLHSTPRAGLHNMSTPQHVAPPSGQNIHVRPSPKPTIHIKQERGMKIITQATPSTAGRILPKPASSQVLVVSSASPVSLVSKGSTTATAGVSHIQGSKVLNISTSAGRILATSAPRSTTGTMVSVNPKTLQFTTIKGPGGATVLTSSNRVPTTSGSGAKPNVIVVQKAQAGKKIGQTATPTIQVTRTSSSSATSSPFEKELMSFIQRHEPSIKPGMQRSILERKMGRGSGEPLQRKHVVVRQKGADGSRLRSVTLQGANKSILAELIQAVGMPQGGGESSEESRAVASLIKDKEIYIEESGKQWVEYDSPQDSSGTPHSSGQTTKIQVTESSAIKALLDLQQSTSTSRSLQHARPSTLHLSNMKGEEITLERIPMDDQPPSPDLQIIGTSGLEDEMSPSSSTSHRTVIPGQKIQLVDEAGNIITNPEELNQLSSLISQNVNDDLVGEIDLKTGLLYTSSGVQEATAVGDEVAIQVISSEDHQAEQAHLKPASTKTLILSASSRERPSDPHSSSADKLDFISNALNQAQIDLDSYQYVGDSEQVQYTDDAREESSNQPVVEVISGRGDDTGQTTVVKILEVSSSSAGDLPAVVTEIGNSPEQVLIPSHSSIGPLVGRYITKVATVPNKISVADIERKPGVHIIKTVAAIPMSAQLNHPASVAVPATVTELGGLDPGLMKLSELSSQQADADLSGEDMFGTGYLDAGDIAHNIRLSKRKRKAPLPADEVTSPSQPQGWVKLAVGVITRVMRFRGAYKEKGQINAASWFNQPVDVREVPDYYDIIQDPMDFGTVKRKLESGQYLDMEEFREDVVLVRDNCHRYNPPATEVRQDCDEVFAFFSQEYEKLKTRAQMGYTSSPVGKKLRMDRSPIRP